MQTIRNVQPPPLRPRSSPGPPRPPGQRRLGSIRSAAHGSPAPPPSRPGEPGRACRLLLGGLAPGGRVRPLLHAGKCARSGASFAVVAEPRADDAGTVRTAAGIRFHSLPVSMRTIADGAHLIAVVAGSRVVACGVVPRR